MEPQSNPIFLNCQKLLEKDGCGGGIAQADGNLWLFRQKRRHQRYDLLCLFEGMPPCPDAVAPLRQNSSLASSPTEFTSSGGYSSYIARGSQSRCGISSALEGRKLFIGCDLSLQHDAQNVVPGVNRHSEKPQAFTQQLRRLHGLLPPGWR